MFRNKIIINVNAIYEYFSIESTSFRLHAKIHPISERLIIKVHVPSLDLARSLSNRRPTFSILSTIPFKILPQL